MGKAKWWVCDSCHSLNDLPADKCYKCRGPKPDNPRQMDDQYAEVATEHRVGITVDLAKVGDLTRPDPVETQEGGGFIDPFDPDGVADPQAQQPASQAQQPSPQPYDPYAAPPRAPSTPTATPPPQQPAAPPPPKPLRDPKPRGIDQLGGVRQWADGVEVMPPMQAGTGQPAPYPDQAPPPQAPPPPPPPGQAPTTPPPQAAPPPQAPPPAQVPPSAQMPPPPPPGGAPPPTGPMPPPSEPGMAPPPPAPAPEKPPEG